MKAERRPPAKGGTPAARPSLTRGALPVKTRGGLLGFRFYRWSSVAGVPPSGGRQSTGASQSRETSAG